MRIVKHSLQLPIENFDSIVGSGMSTEKRHGTLLPNTIRCIICGPSNCGKTNVLFNLLFDSNGLRFKNLYVFSKSLYQPKYKFLSKTMPKEVGYFAFDENTNVPPPSDAKPDSIMIFDDIACEKHDNIRSYFTMGRHKNIDTFYLGQTYSRVPKQLIRDNCNFLIIFKQDDMNLRHIYSDHVNTDMTFEKFKMLCSIAWKENHGFVVIDKDSDIDKGRYRTGLDSFVQDL
jgi:hypothetical protein